MNQSGKARNARINKAIQHSTELLLILNKLQGFSSNVHVDQKDSWQDGRNTLEQLIQCFHEANAYNNVVGNEK